jgi:hypothetical protein
MIFSACLGTLSDYILITQGLYSFPLRPFPAMFDVNIFFTLFILPAATFVFLIYAGRVSFTQRLIMIIVIGAIMPEMEAMSEKWGWFVHSEDWTHIYSFFGYIVYLWVIWTFHRWVTQLRLSVK